MFLKVESRISNYVLTIIFIEKVERGAILHVDDLLQNYLSRTIRLFLVASSHVICH